MDTPIVDFAGRYAGSEPVRLHMPGHKGVCRLGCESRDLTEIAGADELYAPAGVIAASEENAGRLFGCRTVYSAEGSSLCIRAMLYLAMQHSIANGKRPVIAAARNAHKTFMTAAALLDFDIRWIPGEGSEGYLSAGVTPECLRAFLAGCDPRPTVVYVTSPDYLGHMADIRGLAAACHALGVLLLVDNAHGAYLRFLEESRHPMDLGADLCCDSAHKTLPVLTGGAYLHIAAGLEDFCRGRDKAAMGLFGSTSPSYLILQSLDLCNALLAEEYPRRLAGILPVIDDCRRLFAAAGWRLCGDEPMKLSLAPRSRGYTGLQLAAMLAEQRIVCEFADPDHLVLMPSPDTAPEELRRVVRLLTALPAQAPLPEEKRRFSLPERVLSPREVLLAPTERLPVEACVGRVCAELAVSCPPAVPLVMCGERIAADMPERFRYYGISACTVVR